MWLEIIIFVVLVLSFKFLFDKSNKKSFKYPPGPKGLPILGNVHQILRDPHLQLSKWAQDHGNLYTISLAGEKAVVANDASSMKSLFGSMSATGRFKSEIVDQLLLGNYGCANAEGHIWLEQQKFTIKALKKFGFGTGSRQDPVILAECDNLCKTLHDKIKNSETSEALMEHPRKLILQSTGTILWNMITEGSNESGESVAMADLAIECAQAMNDAAKSGLAFFSVIKYLAPEKSGYNNFIKAITKLQALAQKYFDDHKKTRVPGADESRDVIDEYLQQMETCKDPNSSFYGEEGRIHSLASVIALLVPGTETTATTLNWLLFYLAVDPHVQEKLQQEIDSQIGKFDKPSLKDKHRMPYLEAVIYETLRHSSAVAFGLIHRLLEDAQVEDFILPKGTILIANIYRAHHNPKFWQDPGKFCPERFLEGDEGHRKKLRESVVAFQDGRRKCLGEPLAKDVLFLFTARLLQNFSFAMEAGKSKEDYMTPNVGYLLTPPIVGLVVRSRL